LYGPNENDVSHLPKPLGIKLVAVGMHSRPYRL